MQPGEAAPVLGRSVGDCATVTNFVAECLGAFDSANSIQDNNTDPAKTKETSTKSAKWDEPEGPNSKVCTGSQRRSRFRKWDTKPKTSFCCGEAARRPPAQRVGRLSFYTYESCANNLKNNHIDLDLDKVRNNRGTRTNASHHI
jgi:hypothetical protein